jgi:hypothetical protein
MARAVYSLLFFARWYWNRVKEFPLVFAAFTAGCVFEAILITFPPVLKAVMQWALG